jgi:hypothetical protein
MSEKQRLTSVPPPELCTTLPLVTVAPGIYRDSTTPVAYAPGSPGKKRVAAVARDTPLSRIDSEPSAVPITMRNSLHREG